MKKKYLSICVPTYNRCEQLKRQVDYLLKEMVDGIEIIISDNCSSDGTYQYLLSIENPEKGVFINRNESNLGTEGNMYQCAHIASGEYIYFLSDDDILKSGFISELLCLLQNNDIDYYHFNYKSFDDAKQLIYSAKAEIDNISYRGVELTKDEITELVSRCYSSLLFMSSSVYRRSFVLECEKDCHSYVETLRLSILAMCSGKSYFDNRINILSGINTSWSQSRGRVWFEKMPKMIESLMDFGFTNRQVVEMRDNVLVKCIFAYYITKSYKISDTDWMVRIKELATKKVRYAIAKYTIKRALVKLYRVLFRIERMEPISEEMRKSFLTDEVEANAE